MNFSQARIISRNEVEQMIVERLAPLPRDVGGAYALVYLIESNELDGSPVKGFRPGYIATVWPRANISHEWLVGVLSDGTEFYFLPRNKWGEGGEFQLDVEELVTPTFSLTRQ